MKKSILIIDENNQEYLNFINALKKEFLVDDVGFIETARYKLRKKHYDLIILDIMMPPLGLFDINETTDGLRTGFVFFEKELKQLNIPVLFWSWNSDFDNEIKELKKQNTDWNKTDFLLKESEHDHLLKGVKQFLF